MDFVFSSTQKWNEKLNPLLQDKYWPWMKVYLGNDWMSGFFVDPRCELVYKARKSLGTRSKQTPNVIHRACIQESCIYIKP